MWTLILQMIGGAVVIAMGAFAIVLILETRFDIIDQNWMMDNIHPIYKNRFIREFQSKLGPFELFRTRSAAYESSLVAGNLNVQVTYYGLERIPKDMPFVLFSNHQTLFDACFTLQAANYVRGNEGAKVLRVQTFQGDSRDAYSLPLLEYGNDHNRFIANGAEAVTRHLQSGNPLMVFASGRHDARLLDKNDYFRFKSGFLRFARDAQVGLLPVYIDMYIPLKYRVISSLWPKLGGALIGVNSHRITEKQHIKITFGNFIPFEEIPKEDLESNTTKKPQVLRKYEKLVFNLRKDDKLRAKSTQMDFRKAA